MSIFPLKDKIPCENDYFQTGKYAKNSSTNLKKMIHQVQNESKKEDTIEKVFSKTRPTMAINRDENIDYIDIQLAEDLKETRRHRFLEEKRRQQLREDTQELRELESKLRAAYIAKGLAAQRSEKMLLLKKQKEKENYENELLEEVRITYDENERLKEELERKKRMQLMTELKDQMKLNEQQKLWKMEELVEEKKAVNDVVRRIWQEQYEEQLAKAEKRKKLIEETNEFFESRQILKAELRKIDDEENKDIETLKKEVEERERKAKEVKLAKLKEREILSEKIGKKLSLEMKEKQKRIEILEDLLIEEKAARDEDLERKENAVKIIQQTEHRIGLCTMIENNKRRAQEQAEEEKQYRNVLLQELARKDKLDKLKEDEKKQKILEHKKAIRDGLDYQVQLRAEELTKLITQRENDIRESQKQQQLIEEERIRMLQEHAKALQGFFPPGVLKKSDRQHLSMSPN